LAGSAKISLLDSIDREIITLMELDGRQSVTALAEAVGVSVPTCHRRLRRLEQSGVIRGYRAVVDPETVGVGFEAIVHVTMSREDAATIGEFEQGIEEIPEIRVAERLFGDPDYLLRVFTVDMAAYQRLRDERLAVLPGVQRLTSTIVMKRIVEERPFASPS
jgi:DNA-binding Lrp family transcriptional regulator